jgi:polyisoprenoid-binding protein YceI
MVTSTKRNPLMTTIEYAVNAPLQGLYVIDRVNSSISFVTMPSGLGNQSGNFTLVSGSIEVIGSSAMGIHVSLEAASFNTHGANGGGGATSGIVPDAERYPEITSEAAAPDPGDARRSVDGVLTVREIAMRVPLAIRSLKSSEGELHLHALATVDRYAFGISRAMGTMSRKLPVRIQLTAHRR